MSLQVALFDGYAQRACPTQAQKQDWVQRITAVHQKIFGEVWDSAALATHLDQSLALIIATADDALGYALAQYLPPQADLLFIGTLPQARRRGLALTLLTSLEAELTLRGCTEILLEVAEDNLGALALYQGWGATQIARRSGYYHRAKGGPVDALLFQRRFEAAIKEN